MEYSQLEPIEPTVVATDYDGQDIYPHTDVIEFMGAFYPYDNDDAIDAALARLLTDIGIDDFLEYAEDSTDYRHVDMLFDADARRGEIEEFMEQEGDER